MVTMGTCADSYQQNQTVFPVKWTQFYLEEKTECNFMQNAESMPLHLFSEFYFFLPSHFKLKSKVSYIIKTGQMTDQLKSYSEIQCCTHTKLTSRVVHMHLMNIVCYTQYRDTQGVHHLGLSWQFVKSFFCNVSHSTDTGNLYLLWTTNRVTYVCHSLSFLKMSSTCCNRILPTIVIVQDVPDSCIQ